MSKNSAKRKRLRGGECIKGAHVFGAEAETDDAGGKAAQIGEASEHFERPGRRDGLRAIQHAANHAILYEDLQRLRGARWKSSALLDSEQVILSEHAVEELGRQDIGGGDGILNREIDSHAADGRHGMSRIADAKQAG